MVRALSLLARVRVCAPQLAKGRGRAAEIGAVVRESGRETLDRSLP